MLIISKLSFFRGVQTALLHTAAALTLLLIPVWYRLPGAPPPFSQDYFIGFIIFIPLCITVLLTWRTILKQPSLIILLALWALMSYEWAFMQPNGYPSLAQNAAAQMTFAILFALGLRCISPRFILAVLIVGMLLHGMIGGLQVANQASLGLPSEFELDPQVAGVSVIQSGDVRWLRPYGLASHPNIFAGYIVIGLLASSAWILGTDRRLRWLGVLAFGFGLWILFLTFSRGAWVGFAVGAGIIFIRWRNRHLWIALGTAVMLGILFVLMYGNLLLSRAGAGGEAIERRSIDDRTILMDAAFHAIQENLLLGVGAGNFDWYAAYYFFYDLGLDRKGENVHNVYLLVQAELGMIGSAIFLLFLGNSVRKNIQTRDTARYICGSGGIALAVITLVDHYPFTLLHFQALWFSLLIISSVPIIDLTTHTKDETICVPNPDS